MLCAGSNFVVLVKANRLKGRDAKPLAVILYLWKGSRAAELHQHFCGVRFAQQKQYTEVLM